ncbi:APC amino acid permease [Coprinellus micaceus]|uniref:APC amino acid permease n=1 Tax=Coprinellus micaceus TaxID=71717 RepID=A0A4Y7TA34_COPMI|nr:APC amino acid permease [Coprinellus micaceus]
MSSLDGERGGIDERTRLVDPAQPRARYESVHVTSTHSDEGIRERSRTPISSALNGEEFDNVPKVKRTLGLYSTAFLIFNRVIGTGIYATPSNILRSSGSVGVDFIMWVIGALIAVCGTSVYVELGTGLPRSGGEKNYIEFIYRRPQFLATCVYTLYGLITGTAAANSVVFSEYLLHSLSIEPTYYITRFTAFGCLTFILTMHGTFLAPWGLRLQNTLGAGKLLVLISIVLAGLLSLVGVAGFSVKEGYEVPRNFQWDKFWEGSRGKGANAFVNGLYNVMWSFVGYSNANYALSEVRDPVKTIKKAAPLAMSAVTAVYLLINVAYFAVVSKNDILNSNRIVAALFFRNLFGPATEKVLSAFIALSTLGNLLAGQFSQGRVIQELGREGVVPFSSFFASNKPFGAPLPGLFTQYVVSCVFLLLVPPGDAYLFLISLSSYCITIINTLVALGLFLLYTEGYRGWAWKPPFRAPKALVLAFFFSNIFLLIVPFIPPVPGSRTYEQLPYWAHPVGGFCVSLFGIAYWYIWAIWLPETRGYRLEREIVSMDDGVTKTRFRKVRLLEDVGRQ